MNFNSERSQSLQDWLFYLEQQHPTEIELGLDRVRTVAEQANVLDLKAKHTVLVAGTNGKGTTIRFIELCLLKLGFRVGVFSSPHLFNYNERVRINGQELNDEEHVRAFEHIESCKKDISLTYFEFSTLAAYRIFQQAELDVVLVEVGLGGRLDSTNIIEQDISVITSIGLDHTDWLGETREAIGFEKAGIFKAGNIAVVGEPVPPITIQQQAETHGVREINYFGTTYSIEELADGKWSYKGETRFESLSPSFVPLSNLASAITVMLKLNLALNETLLNDVIDEFSLSGRMQVLQSKPIQMVDVAHNPHAVKYLASVLRSRKDSLGFNKVVAVVAMMKDKDIYSTLKEVEHLVDEWFVADLPGNMRAATKEQLASVLHELNIEKYRLFDDVASAWKAAVVAQDKEALLLGFGSFYTVGEVLQTHNKINEV